MSIDKACAALLQTLKAERQPFDSLYQEVADYTRPSRAAFTTTIQASSSGMENLFEDIGIASSEQFATGLHAMNNSALSRWFTLEFDAQSPDDKDLAQSEDNLAWRDMVVEWLYNQFNGERSAFHPTVQEVYQDVGDFGYGIATSEWDPVEKSTQFQAVFPGSVYIIEDVYGRFDGMAQCYKRDAAHLLSMYAGAIQDENDRQKLRKATDPVEVQYFVLPKWHPAGAQAMRDYGVAKNKNYVGVLLCPVLRNPLLSVEGFISCPVHAARWSKRTGLKYPGSPGQSALPLLRRLNAAQRDLTIIMHRMAEPPSQGPDDEFLAPYSIDPGARNFYRPGTNDRVEIIQASMGDVNPLVAWVQDMQRRVQKLYYADAFLVTQDSNGQNVKAAFVYQRRDERFRQLAAIMSRMEREFNSSLIRRVYELGRVNGLIPTPPFGKDFDKKLKIKYLSPIVRAQRSEVLEGLTTTLELLYPFAQIDPTIFEVFDKYGIAEFAGRDVQALPTKILRSREAYEEVVRQRQQRASEESTLVESEAARNYGNAIASVSKARAASAL